MPAWVLDSDRTPPLITLRATFFYGLGIGYVIGVVLSTVVDMIWFPTAGHRVHWW